MAVSQLDSIHLWTVIAAVVLMASAYALGRLRPGTHGPIENLGATGRFRLGSILLVAILAFSADALISWWRHPVPEILDEFSYLLQADTFAHGRVSNPPPPLPEHFEAPYVLVRPTYQSKYPPAQALFLAAGQRLFHRPIAGVWLSSAAFAAALCWMLQAWLPPVWAFYGSLLAVGQLACFGHWSQSYWGGMVAATGGALLFGGLRRLVDRPRKRDAALMGLGVVILANSRPYEGLIVVLAAAAVLIAAWRGGNRHESTPARQRRMEIGHSRTLRQKAVLGAILLVIFVVVGGLMVFYNQRVVHSAFTLPYQAYERQYNPAPILFFQPLRPMPALASVALESSAVDALQEVHWARHSSLEFVTSKLFFSWQFAFGAILGIPLLLVVLLERYPWYVRVLQVLTYAATQLIALRRFLFWPRPNELLVAGLLAALLVQVWLLFRAFRGRWERIAIVTTGLVLLGIIAESARFRTHYLAPVIPLTLFLVTDAMRRVYEASRQRRFFAGAIVAGVPLLALAMMAAVSFAPPTPIREWARRRAAMETQLEAQPGKQMVLVKYGAGHDYYEEWVYNHADLDNAKVVWARDLGDGANNQLIDYFPDRKVWWLDADRYDLQPHPPKDANELPLLQ